MGLKDFKIAFDKLYSEYLEKKIQFSKDIVQGDRLSAMIDHIKILALHGGKRIRPYACTLLYEGVGGKNRSEIERFSLIFELLHLMALVHDDIIDEAALRHSVPTMHTFMSPLVGGRKNIAQGQALLVGDLLLARVYELIDRTKYDFNETLLYEAQSRIHEMIQELILGQMIDVDMMVGDSITEELLDKKNLYKSAGYTFARPMTVGAILGGATPEQIQQIQKLGEELGHAFQIRDDLHDILATETDKRIFSDVQEGQQTYFTHYIFTHGSSEQKNILQQSMGKELDDQDIVRLQEVFEQSGALAYGKQKIASHLQAADNILDSMNYITESVRTQLQAIRQKISE